VLGEVLYGLFPPHKTPSFLVTLDVSVDPPHKQIRAQVTNSSYTFKRTKSVLQAKKYITSFIILRSIGRPFVQLFLEAYQAAKSTTKRCGKWLREPVPRAIQAQKSIIENLNVIIKNFRPTQMHGLIKFASPNL
jgi:hypothetical protein